MFLSRDELKIVGFKTVGENARISRNATFYSPDLITIGKNVRIDDFVVMSGKISLGDFVHIGAHCSLLASSEEIVLQDFSGLSPGCRVFAVSDDFSGLSLTNPTVPNEYKNLKKGKVTFERHVIVGSNSVVGPGVMVREGVAVGALSLITSDVRQWTIVAGVPAKEIGIREKELLRLELEFRANIRE